MNQSSSADFEFTSTGYEGYEDEILRLRNANRPIAQSAAYLQWRYVGFPSTREPEVFWIRDRTGRALGMAALIFRHFWINNELKHVAILGDISLGVELRGQGLGRSLLKFMSEDLVARNPDSLAFVIPNRTAQGILSTVSWTTRDTLIPHVFILNPERKLRRVLPGAWLPRQMAAMAAKLAASIIRRNLKPGYRVAVTRALDDSFETFWNNYDKTNVCLSDRSIGALKWRYIDHPLYNFQFATLLQETRLAGYLVYELSEETRECTVYDLILSDPDNVNCMLALLVEHCRETGNIDSIRILFNEQHPYRKKLWKLGFIPRGKSGVFQLYGSKAQAGLENSTWFLTYGDKDI